MLLASVAAIAVMPTVAAHAQTAPASTAPAPTEQPAAGGQNLPDIVVTANKREQNLNDVGLAITALGGQTLKNQQVTSLADLARAVPSLTFQPTQYSTPVYTLRGVGFYDNTLASYPTVSVYLDEAPQPVPVLTSHTAFDLERVEVLKGPQGTLFGNNSTGGAINFIAAKPTDKPEAGADLSFSRFARVDGNAYISGPITDNLKGRIAVNGAMGDDWQYSYTRPNEKNGQVGYFAGRALLDWKPAPGLRFRLDANGWRDTSDPQAPQFVGLIPQFPNGSVPGVPITVPPALNVYPLAPANARAADWSPNAHPSIKEEMGMVSLRGDLDITNSIALTSISTYSAYSRKDGNFEFDGTSLGNGDYRNTTGAIHSFSQELRIANSGHSRLRWVIGGNYERTNTREFSELDFSDISAAAIFGFTGDRLRAEQNMRNYAAFGNVEYDVIKQLTVKAGIRYTKADRSFNSCTYDRGDGTFAAAFTNISNAINAGFIPIAGYTPSGKVIPLLSNTQCADLDNVTFDGTPATYEPGEMKAKLNQDNVSWRVGVDFKPIDHLLFYGNVARGYKAGSFPFLSGASFEQSAPVTQESILSFEAGFKAELFDRRINLSGAGFYYKYSDKQLRGKIPDPVFGLLEALVNVPRSELKGIELELSGNPFRGFSLGLAGSYIHSEILDYTNFSRTGQLTDFAGSPIPYTPKWQFNATADYRWDMGGVRPFVGATYNWRSKSDANLGGSRNIILPPGSRNLYPLDQLFEIQSYGLLDLRAGIESQNGGWKLTVWGKNVLNKYYSTNVQTSFDNIVRYAGMPVTYGVTFGVKFR
jgi:outer membrane receptor protein involved in Fe transport